MVSVQPQIKGLTDWQPLARGGLAKVWQARQVSLDRLVAVKIYERALDETGDQRRFLQESSAAGRLSGHSAVVTVHDAGILADGRPFLLMDLYTGGSLTSWIKAEERPSEEQVRHVGVRVADALAAAHAAGVLHRDVKPSNVLIDSYGEPGLADFGLATVRETEVTGATVQLTPAFAAPEVLRGSAATESADVFSLAATLYALLAGRPLRLVEQPPQNSADLARIADQPVPALTGANWHLASVLTDALDDEPGRRPTAAEFRDRLSALDLARGVRRSRAAAKPVAGPKRALTETPAAAAAAAAARSHGAGPGDRRHRRRAVLVPLAIVAVLTATAGSVAAWTSRTPTSSVAAAAQGSPVLTPSTGPTGSTRSASEQQAVEAAERSLRDCQERVRAADEVIKAADVGVGHWAEHVQAQTDQLDGKITDDTMQKIFMRTRLAGSADGERYADAVEAYDDTEGSCSPPEGAPATIRTAMADCAERADAQKPVLAAADRGAQDWASHLADMRKSRAGHVHNAQAVWMATWRAAPENIQAWQQVRAGLPAIRC